MTISATGIFRDGDGYGVILDTTIYSVTAIKKAAYKFAGRASVVINPKNDTSVAVFFDFIGHPLSNPEDVIGDFCNEVLDQDLREIIKQETTPLRNLILAHAFSRTSLASEK